MKVGLIIGHNFKDQGAKAYNGQSEYQICEEAAEYAFRNQKDLLPEGTEVVIFRRPSSKSYSEQCKMVSSSIEKEKCDIVIALHLNAFQAVAYGCEGLILDTEDEESIIYKTADTFTDILGKKLGIKERGRNGVKLLSKGHRGYLMLKILKDYGIDAMIAEPCFINFKTKESKLIVEKPSVYGRIILETIAAFGGKECQH